MPLAAKIILHCPLSNPARLDKFVEQCLRDQVRLIATWGEGCERIEDTIDELIVGDASNPQRGEHPFLNTTSHPDESIDEVVTFAAEWEHERGDQVQEVHL